MTTISICDFVYDVTLPYLCILSSDISWWTFSAFCFSWHWNRQAPAASPTPTPRKHCSLNRCVGADMWNCYWAAPYLLPDRPAALLLKQWLTSTKMNILSIRYCNTAISNDKHYIRACTFLSLEKKSLHKLVLSTWCFWKCTYKMKWKPWMGDKKNASIFFFLGKKKPRHTERSAFLWSSFQLCEVPHLWVNKRTVT